MAKMKEGDYISSHGYLLVCEVSFKEMCSMYDDNCLEYDMDDLWNAYQERGTPWRALTDLGRLTIVWPSEISEEEVISNEAR